MLPEWPWHFTCQVRRLSLSLLLNKECLKESLQLVMLKHARGFLLLRMASCLFECIGISSLANLKKFALINYEQNE